MSKEAHVDRLLRLEQHSNLLSCTPMAEVVMHHFKLSIALLAEV